MVIDDLDVQGVSALEAETNTPLVVDTNAELAGAIATQFFKPVARWHAKEIERRRGMNICSLRSAMRSTFANRATRRP